MKTLHRTNCFFTLTAFVCAFSLAMPLYSLGQAFPYRIVGTVTAWKGTDTIVMFHIENDTIVKDTTLARDGRFTFTGTAAQPALTYISCRRNPRPDFTQVYLEKGTIRIEGKDSLATAVIKAGQINKDHIRLRQLLDSLNKRSFELRQSVAAAPAGKQRDSIGKLADAENVIVMDSLRTRMTRFILQNTQSFISLEMVSNLAGVAIDYKKIAPLFYSLAPAVCSTPLGQQFEKKLLIAKNTGIGVTAPVFTAATPAGDSLQLQSIVHKGKLTLVDFWASWCKPCRAENPNVVKAWQTFHEKGFNILSVSLDSKADKWKDAIAADGMPWYHVSGLQGWKEPVAQLYGVSAVPDNFLLDGEGRVVARGLRGKALYDTLKKLLTN